MSDLLPAILAETRARVEAAERRASLEALRSRVVAPALDFGAALAMPKARFILECKGRSPSRGVLRRAYDPVEVAEAYAGVADAVSVLTDGPFFGGSLDDLARVRQRVSAPILAKDFILGPYQVVEARVAGADAVLLMASVLDDPTLSACLEEVDRLGMQALVEVHDEAELARALEHPAPIIGINNRDLRTLEVRRETTLRLAPRVPEDRLVVAESGYGSRAQVDEAAPVVDAFLVGSALTGSDEIRGAARDFVHGRVKICGLRRAEDVDAAREAGALFGGIVFAPGSKRRVELDEALALNERGLPLVVVVRDQPVREVAAIGAALRPTAIQLHGDEDDDFVRQLRPLLPETTSVWKVCGVDERGRFREKISAADRTVFDRRTATDNGGTGRRFEWTAISTRPDRGTGLLAGGLRPENASAARAVGTWALDVSTGIEASPGVKSPSRIESFFMAMRAPSRREVRDVRAG